MSDHQRTQEPPVEAAVVLPFPGNGDGHRPPEEPPPSKPKIRWLRLLALLSGLGLLAVVSTVFGMMMAVASDLPELDVLDVAENPSKLYDRSGKVELGTLTGNERRILVRSEQIAPVMKHAIVAIEDRRYFTNSGVDLRGIARALYQDIVQQRIVQGGSTITQQLVKNRLDAQNDRTLFQKLREAAIAFHMTEKWDKQRILSNYLNTIYFGNGAYGIESAARTYFGYQYPQCGEAGQRFCASQLEPHEAALLAGVVASPTGYDPIANPAGAKARRDLVLDRMLEQGYLSRAVYERSVAQPVPAAADINPPTEESDYPYFTTWVRQQVVDHMGAGAAFEGGLRVRTTLDARMQEAAEAAVDQLTDIPGAPSAALVAVDNSTSEVLAMVGGDSEQFDERPFNLATQGQRQPGSAFKPFTLISALEQGIARPDSTFTSQKKTFCVTRSKGGKCRESFEVNNYEDSYAGVTTLANATAHSDNSVYAELGIKAKTGRIADLAEDMGIRTPVSKNLAITLGGLEQGVTVLDMAHAYATIATDGRLVYGTLSPDDPDDDVVPGPVAIKEITTCRRAERGDDRCRAEDAETLEGDKAVNRRRVDEVFSAKVADQVKGMLAGVVKFGTARRAALPGVTAWGKTGTTEDYGDAWFVGSTEEYTVAVWVGYPDAVKPMKPPLFSYQGEPVAGGTWPTVIWHSFMRAAMEIHKSRLSPKERAKLEGTPTPPAGSPAPSAVPPAPDAPAAPEGGAAPQPETPEAQAQPQQEAPQQQQEPEPPPQTAQPNPTVAPEEQSPSGGGGASPPDGL